MHHELDAQTLAALEADPPPKDELVVAGWHHLRAETTTVLARGRAGRASIERALLRDILSWAQVAVPVEMPPCRVVDKQWDARRRHLGAVLLEGPSELARALGVKGSLRVCLEYDGRTNTWLLAAIYGLGPSPPFIIPVFLRPGPRARVSGLAATSWPLA